MNHPIRIQKALRGIGSPVRRASFPPVSPVIRYGLTTGARIAAGATLVLAFAGLAKWWVG